MTEFRKYDHLVRLSHSDCASIDIGTVYVFPKIDGTNASVWHDGGETLAASRNRVLSPDADNAGFCAWVQSDDAEPLRRLAEQNPHLIFYGEWLVPHTLKTYREAAWRKFWVFDVYDRTTERYLPYDYYSAICHELDVIEPLCKILNPTEDQLRAQIETNTYLIADNAGLGEGVVVKNYDWANKYGRQPWAKIVRNDFKEANRREFGVTEKSGKTQVEALIADEFVTPHLIGKTRAKVLLELANQYSVDTSRPNWQQSVEADYRGRVIPALLGKVFHDLVEEELWGALKKHKFPAVDFKRLRQFSQARCKAVCADLFA